MSAHAGGLEVSVQGAVGQLSLDVTLSTGAQVMVLLGPNGSGKTSLLLMILGIVRPRRGRISIGEEVLFDAAEKLDLPPEARGLGYLPQDYGLFPHQSVRENVEFGLRCREPGLLARARRERVDELLARLDLSGLSERRPGALSGGERQRVGLARALAAKPRALLLDEPLAALDAGARQKLRCFLAESLSKLDLPALVVTHDPADAEVLGHKVAVLEAGRVAQVGTVLELRRAPATPFVEELFTR